MLSRQLILLFVYTLLAVTCRSDPDRDDNKMFQLCGSRLSDFMSTVCGGKGKRSNSDGLETWDPLNDILDDILNASRDDLTGQSTGDYSIPRYARLRRKLFGIADECCKKACNLKTLKSYC